MSYEAIPLTILTGYLGAGKTTLLNHILHGKHGLRVAVLVNDFGRINIDSQLVVGVQGQMVTLANGCICCTIRGDLVEAVGDLLNHEHPPEYILIEASGVSDPAQVVLTFHRSGLRNRLRVDSIIAMVDSEQFADIQGKPERLTRSQVTVADMVVMNKIDLVTDEQRARVEALIREIAPNARIIAAKHADVPLELILDVGAYNPQRAFFGGDHGIHVHAVDEAVDHEHHDHSLVFSTWSWTDDEPVSISNMRAVLDELPLSVFRAKGILYTDEFPDRKVLMQLVGKRVTIREGDAWGDDEARHTQIVMIAEQGTLNPEELEARFNRTVANNKNGAPGMKLLNGFMQWLRTG